MISKMLAQRMQKTAEEILNATEIMTSSMKFESVRESDNDNCLITYQMLYSSFGSTKCTAFAIWWPESHFFPVIIHRQLSLRPEHIRLCPFRSARSLGLFVTSTLPSAIFRSDSIHKIFIKQKKEMIS